VASKWTKPPARLVEAFARVFAGFPGAEQRQMFGCPCFFLNGNMFSGLHEESWIIRLDGTDRKELLAAGGNEFTPMERVMKEYATLPQDVVEEPRKLQRWLAKSFAYVKSLPPKAPKKRSKRAGRDSAKDA
jgi:TfoX/Sxy family transcriptional regulator of competence genes